LGRLSGALDGTLEDHHHFELVLEHVARREMIKRGLLVDFVTNRHGPDEEQIVVAAVSRHVQLRLEVAQDLPFLGLPRADQLRPDARPYNVTLPHIPHPEHERKMSLALADHRVPREQQRLGPQLGSCHFSKHDPDHEGLDHHSDDALHRHDEDRFGTLLGGGPHAVPDGVLRLYTEEVARGEAVDVEDARGPVVLRLVLREVLVLQVPVSEHDQPPDQRESQPRDEERQGEDDEGPPPLNVDQSGEHVLQIADPALGDSRLEDVAVAIFENCSSADLPDGTGAEGLPETWRLTQRQLFATVEVLILMSI
jgi:hypothetical protein